MRVENVTQSYEDRIYDSFTALVGAGVGGGLFLIAVVLGVIFWISREKEEDEEVRIKAEKVRGDRRRGMLVDPEARPSD